MLLPRTIILAFFSDSYNRIHDHIKVPRVITDSGLHLKQFIERLEEEHLTCIIAVMLIRPIRRQVYILNDWKEIAKGFLYRSFLSWVSKRVYP